MERLLPTILATITRHPRQQVTADRDFKWSNSIIYNLFRMYELIFWRRVGIRRESAMSSDGVYQFFTLEALLVHLEGRLRLFKWPVRVFIPVTAGLPMPLSPYLFAIAYDNSTASAASSNTGQTLSYTATGSNPIVVTHSGTASGTGTTGMTWNANTMVATDSTRTDGASEHFDQWCYTGVAGTFNAVSSCGSGFNAFVATSYSGVNQSNTPDSHNGGVSGVNIVSFTVATTVVAANCWTFTTVGSSNSAPTSGTNATLRLVGSNVFITSFDSNGTVGTGSISMTVNGGGSVSQFSMITSSFAPVGGAPVVVPMLSSLGAGS